MGASLNATMARPLVVDWAPLRKDAAVSGHIERDRERRETVQRYHQLKDAEEDFDMAKARALSREERQRLMNGLNALRSQHRAEDVRRGKRQAGTGFLMHQCMWARWIEIAHEHQQGAVSAYNEILAGNTAPLVIELRESLVAFAATAATIEALHEDTKYLIPPRLKQPSAGKTIADSLAAVFGLAEAERQVLMRDLTYVFDRRNEGLHGYSELNPPEAHPAGFLTGAESSRFNGPESTRALDIALRVLALAERPPEPLNRWVIRWVRERAAYHERVVNPIRVIAHAVIE